MISVPSVCNVADLNGSGDAARFVLTMDLDWACDDVVADSMELLSRYPSLPVTIFATHASAPLLAAQSALPNLEIGIHPNFNRLLDGSQSDSTSVAIIEKIMTLFPLARSVRSHSLLQSELLLDQFASAGLTHVCNTYIPWSPALPRSTWKLWENLTVVPHSWQDNAALRTGLDFPRLEDVGESTCVVNIHPIHIFLNSTSMEHYESTRHIHREPAALLRHRAPGPGIRTVFLKILEELALAHAADGTVSQVEGPGRDQAGDLHSKKGASVVKGGA